MQASIDPQIKHSTEMSQWNEKGGAEREMSAASLPASELKTPPLKDTGGPE